jgi:hypothetical protein
MKTNGILGVIQFELVFSRHPGNKTGAAVVTRGSEDTFDASRRRFGCATIPMYTTDPTTGERRPAFMPIETGRLALIEDRGIGHGDHFLADIAFIEGHRKGKPQVQMWLVDAQPLVKAV